MKMKTLSNWRVGLAMVAAGMLAGCSQTAKSPDVAGSIRQALDQSGFKDVSVTQDRDRGVGEQYKRIDGDELADRQLARGHEQRSHPQEEHEHHEPGNLDGSVVEHQHPVAAEDAVGELGEFVPDYAPHAFLGAGALGGLYALDCIELLGGMPRVRLLETVKGGPQPTGGKAHQSRVDRRRGDEHRRHYR